MGSFPSSVPVPCAGLDGLGGKPKWGFLSEQKTLLIPAPHHLGREQGKSPPGELGPGQQDNPLVVPWRSAGSLPTAGTRQNRSTEWKLELFYRTPEGILGLTEQAVPSPQGTTRHEKERPQLTGCQKATKPLPASLGQPQALGIRVAPYVRFPQRQSEGSGFPSPENNVPAP